jgi:hypothetical protein
MLRLLENKTSKWLFLYCVNWVIMLQIMCLTLSKSYVYMLFLCYLLLQDDNFLIIRYPQLPFIDMNLFKYLLILN